VAHRRLRTRFLRGLVAAGGAGVAVGVGVAAAADNPVAISGFSFSPHDITVAVGDSVTRTNSDAQGHTATADDGSFDTGTIANGTSRSVTFATAGTFAYHCSIHPAMTGSVVVEAAAAATAAPTAATTNPPTDTEARAAANQGSGMLGALLIIVGALFVGLAIGRRRFSRS
jgi:plastocyanin